MLEIGQTVVNGKYELLKLIAPDAGAQGQVWQARETESDALVAIKVARRSDPEATARFRLEIQLSRQLTHRNLLRADTTEKEGELRLLVLPLAKESLRQRLKRGEQLSVAQVIQIGMDVGRALGYLHDKDIIHRDVHPGNILFMQDGTVKLADLGFAQSHDTSSMAYRMYGMGDEPHPGHVFYRAPEAENPAPLNPSADVYMLGGVLWECLTGRSYFHKRDQPARKFRSDTPRWLDKLLADCLLDAPRQRPESGRAVAERLHEGVKKKPPIVPFFLKIGGVVLILLLAIFGISRIFSGGNDTPAPTVEVAAVQTATLMQPTLILPTATATNTKTPQPTNTVIVIPPTAAPMPTNTRFIQQTGTPSVTFTPTQIAIPTQTSLPTGSPTLIISTPTQPVVIPSSNALRNFRVVSSMPGEVTIQVDYDFISGIASEARIYASPYNDGDSIPRNDYSTQIPLITPGSGTVEFTFGLRFEEGGEMPITNKVVVGMYVPADQPEGYKDILNEFFYYERDWNE